MAFFVFIAAFHISYFVIIGNRPTEYCAHNILICFVTDNIYSFLAAKMLYKICNAQ